MPGDEQQPLNISALRSIPQVLADGLEQHKIGNLSKAEEGYRTVLLFDPENHDAMHLLGVLMDQKGDHQEAARLLGQAVAKAPHVAMFQLNFGNALVGAGRLEEARDAYNKALELSPGMPEAQAGLQHLG
jgi:Flp pilus assembly protein TadD